MQLRYYQDEATQAIEAAMREHSSLYIDMATGTGKTVVFINIAEPFNFYTGENVLILAHRRKLIRQTRDRLLKFTSLESHEIGVEMGDEYGIDILSPPIVVGSVQSFSPARLSMYERDYFGLIIIDECHHAVAKSYQKIFDYFNAATLVGVTATPERSDGKKISKVFKKCCYRYTIEQGIKDQFLVPIYPEIIPLEHVNLDDIVVIGNKDFTEEQIAAKMEVEEAVHKIAMVCLDRCSDRSTVVFCSSIRHAQLVCDAFNVYRSGCARYIASTLDSDLCDWHIEDFSNGEYQFIINVDMLTEGVDMPRVACVVIGRPTKSIMAHMQRVGRGTRLLGDTYEESKRNGKDNLLVIDFVGASQRHKLITVLDSVFADSISSDVAQEVRRLIFSGKCKSVDEALVVAENIIQERLSLKANRVSYTSKKVDPFSNNDSELSAERRAALINGIALRALEFDKGYDNQDELESMSTPALIQLLKSYKRENECSDKQGKLLQKYGLSFLVSFSQAHALIDMISHNSWKADNEIRDIAKKYASMFEDGQSTAVLDTKPYEDHAAAAEMAVDEPF